MTPITVDVEPILTAEVPMPHAYVFRAGGTRISRLATVLRPVGDVVRAPCLAFVVRHPSEGVILVDTGLHADAATSLRRDFGAPMSVMFRALEPAPEPFDQQLRARGVDPASVKRVVMTHLHVDHTSGLRLLPNAELICSGVEWAAAQGRFGAGKGYVGRHLPPAERVRQLDPARDGVAFGPFARTIDLLGDGSIRLLSTPGHTAGHLSVLLRTGEDQSVLLVGDAAYTLQNIAEQRLPMLTADDGASRRSLAELQDFTEANPEAVVVPTHDPAAWRALL